MLLGHDCIFLLEQPQNEWQLTDALDSLLAASILCHRGRHRRNAVIPCLSPSNPRSLFEGSFELLRPSVRGKPSYLWALFPDEGFSDNFLRRFFPSFWPTAPPKVVSQKKCSEKDVLCSHKLEFVTIIRKQVFDNFFCPR